MLSLRDLLMVRGSYTDKKPLFEFEIRCRQCRELDTKSVHRSGKTDIILRCQLEVKCGRVSILLNKNGTVETPADCCTTRYIFFGGSAFLFANSVLLFSIFFLEIQQKEALIGCKITYLQNIYYTYYIAGM